MAPSSFVPLVLDMVTSQSLSSAIFFFIILCIFVHLRLYYFVFMASSSMAEVRSHGIVVPIIFPIDANGIVVVSEIHLSIRFSFQVNTIWVDREIFNDTRLLVHTFHEPSKVTDNDNVVWELGPRKYRVVGWPYSWMGVSTEFPAPLR